LREHARHGRGALDRSDRGAVDAFHEQRQPAPEDLEARQQVLVIDLGAPKRVTVEGDQQPLQLELGAGRHPQADIDVAQVGLVLLFDPVEAEQQTRGEDDQGGREQAVTPRSGTPDARHRTCRALSCQTDFSLVAKSSSSG
jgi:hypothetical protein